MRLPLSLHWSWPGPITGFDPSLGTCLPVGGLQLLGRFHGLCLLPTPVRPARLLPTPVKSGSTVSDYRSLLDYVSSCFPHHAPQTVSVLLSHPLPVWTRSAAPGLLHLGIICGPGADPARTARLRRLRGPCGRGPVRVHLLGIGVRDHPLGRWFLTVPLPFTSSAQFSLPFTLMLKYKNA